MSSMRYTSILVLALLGAVATAGADPMPSTAVQGARYATDAYPGFDNEEENVKPERKEPRWFSFINGPNRDNAADQYAYCQELLAAEDWSKARKQLDALVREWPTAPEAWKAQLQLAETCLNRLGDTEDAFCEYRYLLDFYSVQCDYAAVADQLYKVAGQLKLEGREVMFVRFANTVDVRRFHEMCVLRAPGAKWVPEAMLTIARLREDEGKFAEAIKVYENLRNLHPDTEEAKTAIGREAATRMIVLREHGYNRARCQDTIDFLTLAIKGCLPADAEDIRRDLAEAKALAEEASYQGAKFYDSSTRTRRSALNAYERFLSDYPESPHADEVRGRIEELKGAAK